MTTSIIGKSKIGKWVGVGLLTVGVLSLLGAHQAVSQDPPVSAPDEAQQTPAEVPKITAERPMSFWMARKLHFSKEILESLTMGEFEELADAAEQMRLLGKLEGFIRRQNADYRIQLRTFDFANQELIRQAKRGNAEGAALAFNQLSNSCVACHIMLREGVQ
jgi:hypothetical protein